MQELKELPLEFLGRAETKTNFLYKQLEKSDNAYLYEVTDSFGNLHYEAFERKEAHNDSWGLHQVSYPSGNAFGVWAWTTRSKKRAYEIFKELTLKVKESK